MSLVAYTAAGIAGVFIISLILILHEMYGRRRPNPLGLNSIPRDCGPHHCSDCAAMGEHKVMNCLDTFDIKERIESADGVTLRTTYLCFKHYTARQEKAKQATQVPEDCCDWCGLAVTDDQTVRVVLKGMTMHARCAEKYKLWSDALGQAVKP